MRLKLSGGGARNNRPLKVPPKLLCPHEQPSWSQCVENWRRTVNASKFAVQCTDYCQDSDGYESEALSL